jgi:uncharacterized protein (TIGR02217 family)
METFPLTPDFPVVETPRFNTLVSTFDNGAEQRRSKWTAPLREFSLQFKNRDKSEFDTLVAFFNSMLGAFTAFTFTNPNDATDYTVRFKDEQPKFSLTSFEKYTFEIQLIEVK